MRPIDADALKDKLQQHHDFYVMAWGGFGKMPIGEKKRVDEITNCIAEVVNAPTIEPKQGEWIEHEQGEWIKHEHGFWTFVNDKGERDGWIPDYECNLCGSRAWRFETNFCPNCGAQMKGADNTPQITMCRDCDDYAGDGMYCASNFLVYDFSTSRENCETERSE